MQLNSKLIKALLIAIVIIGLLPVILYWFFIGRAPTISEKIDLRVVKYGKQSKKCAMLELCTACIKYNDVPCGVHRIFFLIIVFFFIFSFMPLLASTHSDAYLSEILGTSYYYSHAVIYQIFEIRFCPIIAIIFFISAFLVLWKSKEDPLPLTKILFSAGIGFLGFSIFRLLLFSFYRDNLVWFILW